MSKKSNPKNSLERLERILKPYEKWEQWRNSPDFPLSTTECEMIESYAINQSHKVYADLHSIKVISVRQRYGLAIKKIEKESTRVLYKKWEFINKIQFAGLIEQNVDARDIIHPICTFMMDRDEFEGCLSEGRLILKNTKLMPVHHFSNLPTEKKKQIAINSLKFELLVNV